MRMHVCVWMSLCMCDGCEWMLRHFHPPAGWCPCSCSPCRVWFFPRIRRVNAHTLVFCSMRSSYSAHIEMKLFNECVIFIYGERLKFQIDIVSSENMHQLHRFDRNQIKNSQARAHAHTYTENGKTTTKTCKRRTLQATE